MLFKFPGEGRIIPEAALEADICNGLAGGGEQLPGQQQALAGNILMDTVAGFRLEFSH